MLLLGIDVGTSSIKVTVVDADTNKCIDSTQFPEEESPIITPAPGWAEQSPDTWWEHVQAAILKLNAKKNFDPLNIAAIGIAYQMHGLVMVDENQSSLRNSIIWCDSRAVQIGGKAFEDIGQEKCLTRLLNSPGNFTASKLSWVKINEPGIYRRIYRIMLPGDFISMKLTGNITTSISSLSEGIFWDFRENEVSKDVFDYYQLDRNFIPEIQPVFSKHGELTASVAVALSLKPGIPVSYKAGDQPNNALSLNVLEPGEVAATAGTSGVIYAVTDKLMYDQHSRVNSFAHVNHQTGSGQTRIGVLLCINGTGILNRWVKNITGDNINYEQINAVARQVKPGSEGLITFPFGNGAERMLMNKIVNASILNIDLNTHQQAHIYRSAQEGIAFAFRYGFDILKENGIKINLIRAGKANMFKSDLFVDLFVNTLKVPVELYQSDGSVGAAFGAGIGAGIYKDQKEAFHNFKPVDRIESGTGDDYEILYEKWKVKLERQLRDLQ